MYFHGLRGDTTTPKNESGSAGGIITLIGVLLLSGILFLLIGYGIDKIVMVAIKMFATSGSSQLRYDVVSLMIVAFRAEPFVMLIGLGISHWLNALREYSGTIPIGSMIVSAGEMIIGSFFIIVITLFGGMALDMIIGSVNGFLVVGAGTELYSAIQYIPVIYYGLLFLVMIAVICQFIVKCASVADYSRLSIF